MLYFLLPISKKSYWFVHDCLPNKFERYLSVVQQLTQANNKDKSYRASLTWGARWRMDSSWWRHQMETFSALLVICAGNSSVTGEFPAQRPVTRSLNVFFDLCLTKRSSKQCWGWWFETPPGPLWCCCNVLKQGWKCRMRFHDMTSPYTFKIISLLCIDLNVSTLSYT